MRIAENGSTPLHEEITWTMMLKRTHIVPALLRA